MNAPKNKFEYYQQAIDSLDKKGYMVEEYKEINFGLQFNVIMDGQKSLIRVYESKKGIRPDYSQIKNTEVLNKILSCMGQNNEKQKKDDTKSSVDKTGTVGTTNQVNHHEAMDPPELIGTDESGKGDYFGPLVVAGVYVNLKTGQILREMGVNDSKKLTDKQIGIMAPKIKELCPYSIVVIGNEKYNELYEKIKNLNKLLAWGHARTIENVLGKVDCNFALADQFGDPKLIEGSLMDKGKKITLRQRPRAEENIAVAAASILARNEFVVKMGELEKQYGIRFPKGASSKIIDTAREYSKNFGRDKLSDVAKLHFKTTGEI